jgi:hypothetical protein
MGMGCMGGSITDAMLYLCEVSVARLSREADMSADDACKLHPPSTLTMPMQVGAAPELCVPYTAGQTWARRRVLDECRSERPNTRWESAPEASGIRKGANRSEAPLDWLRCHDSPAASCSGMSARRMSGCWPGGKRGSGAALHMRTKSRVPSWEVQCRQDRAGSVLSANLKRLAAACAGQVRTLGSDAEVKTALIEVHGFFGAT